MEEVQNELFRSEGISQSRQSHSASTETKLNIWFLCDSCKEQINIESKFFFDFGSRIADEGFEMILGNVSIYICYSIILKIRHDQNLHH